MHSDRETAGQGRSGQHPGGGGDYFAKAQELYDSPDRSGEAAAHHGPEEEVGPDPPHHPDRQARQAGQQSPVWLFNTIANSNDVTINIAQHLRGRLRAQRRHRHRGTDVERIAPTMIKLGRSIWPPTSGAGRRYRAKRVKSPYWGYDEVWDYYPITKQSARASYYTGSVRHWVTVWPSSARTPSRRRRRPTTTPTTASAPTSSWPTRRHWSRTTTRPTRRRAGRTVEDSAVRPTRAAVPGTPTGRRSRWAVPASAVSGGGWRAREGTDQPQVPGGRARQVLARLVRVQV